MKTIEDIWSALLVSVVPLFYVFDRLLLLNVFARTWQIVAADDIRSALLVSILICFNLLVSSADQSLDLL